MTKLPNRIAITGASGYLASRLIQCLNNMDSVDYILAMDIRKPGFVTNANKITFLQVDVGDSFSNVFKEHRIQSVIHLAYVMNPTHNRDAAWRINVGGTSNLLQACLESDVQQICYLSSTSVYGAHPDNPDFITEESPLRPVRGFQYSEDKSEAEGLLSRYSLDHPKVSVLILRVCPVLGPHADNFIATAFSKRVLVAAKGFDPPMQFIHEDDLVNNVIYCLREKTGGTFNLSGDGVIKWSEMAEVHGRRVLKLPPKILYALAKISWNLRIQRDSPACGLDFIRHRWTASNDRAKRKLGFECQYSSSETWRSFVCHRTQRTNSIGTT